MAQKTTLVTGATDGIGFHTALELASVGHRVLVHGRTTAKAQAAVEKLQGQDPKGAFTAVAGDLSSLAGVRQLAGEVTASTGTLQVLLNNAGVFMKQKALSPDGFEMTFQVNHLSHMALTHALMPLLRAAGGDGGRVVNVSSVAHMRGSVDLENLRAEKGFEGYTAYAMSKLCNVLFTTEFSRRIPSKEVCAYALHPGVIATKLLRTGFGMGGSPDVASGAATSVYLATSTEVTGISGRYYADGQEAPMAPHAADPQAAKALWDTCETLLGIQGGW
jgi:NAD(P)-dependent dehydrogenase (short-subunit alcohol dehydrogenase family)